MKQQSNSGMTVMKDEIGLATIQLKKLEKRKKNKKNKKHVSRIYISDDSSDEESSKYMNYFNNLNNANSSVVYNDNTIYFRSKVSAESVATLIHIIEKKNKDFEELQNNPLVKSIKPEPLYLHITSYGGCLFSGFRAVDAIQRSVIPIYTVIDGPAASAATLMSAVGVKRYMTPNSYMLIHQLSSGVIGKFWEMKDEFHNCKLLMDNIYKIYVEKSKLNRAELEDQLSHDSWWDANKCMEVGLVDGILE
jgi:ATP-dependent protease ClpP protease subunit